MSNLLDALDAPMAEAWRSEEGDKIVGKVINLSSRDAGHGEYAIATLEVETGTMNGEAIKVPTQLAVHCMATVICQEIGWDRDKGAWGTDRKLHLGSTLAIKDLGDREGRTNKYRAYRVIVENPTIADKLDAEDDGALFSS